MRIKLNPLKEELLEAMLRMGMKVGEIQAIFPNINSSTIHSFGKKLGINTRVSKDKSNIEKRNTKAIKELIERSISEGIVVRTPRVDKLLSIIDELAPTPNGRKMNITATLRQRIKIEDELRLELTQTKPLEISQQRDNINER